MTKSDPIDVAAIAAVLKERGVDHAALVASLTAPSWRLRAKHTTQEALTMGQSRFGGRPDVPPDFRWPSHSGLPLSFLVQIDLEDVGAPDLPSRGWLLFFFDSPYQPSGYYTADAGTCRVIYVDVPREALVRVPEPEVEEEDEEDEDAPLKEDVFDPRALTVSRVNGLPDMSDRRLAHLGLPIEQLQGYCDTHYELAGGGAPDHHLLGNAWGFQNDMTVVCELVAAGFDCVDSAFSEQWDKAQRANRSSEWQLLLQLDSEGDNDNDPESSRIFEDMGRLFFWIRREDLAARAFDKAWAILHGG